MAQSQEFSSMAFTENKGVRLHWTEQGEGTPVLLVMGHRYSSAMWYPLIPFLAKKHRVISFDNRGTGLSATTRGVSVGDFAADAIAVMDAAGVKKAHVYGVSMGGVIVLELAIRYPDRMTSLILGCTGMLTSEKPRGSRILRLLPYIPVRLLLWLVRNKPHGYGSAAPAHLVAEDLAMLKKDPSTMRGIAAQQAAMVKYIVSADDVKRLSMPVLILHGDEDQAVPFAYGEELARVLPNNRFVKLQGAGHNYLVATGPAALTAALDFLESIDEGRFAP
jgi:3-oxoadipate enol-lactonase